MKSHGREIERKTAKPMDGREGKGRERLDGRKGETCFNEGETERKRADSAWGE